MSKYKTKKDFLAELKEKCEEGLANLSVDIPMLELLNEDKVLGQKTTGMKVEDVTVRTELPRKKEDKEALEQRLEIINNLLDA